MNRVVVVDGDRHAGERVEPEHRDRLVGRPLAVRSLPPPAGLWIDDLAVNVDVRLSRSISHSGGRQSLPGETNRFDDLLLVVGTALSAGTVRVRRRQQHARRRDSELLLDSRRHRLPQRRRDRTGIHRDECCAGRAVLENNRACIQAIENASAVLRKLTRRRCDIDSCRADAQCRRARRLGGCCRCHRGYKQKRGEYGGERVHGVSHSPWDYISTAPGIRESACTVCTAPFTIPPAESSPSCQRNAAKAFRKTRERQHPCTHVEDRRFSGGPLQPVLSASPPPTPPQPLRYPHPQPRTSASRVTCAPARRSAARYPSTGSASRCAV